MRLGPGIVEMALLTIVVGILMWRVFVEWLNRAYGAGERILLLGSAASLNNLVRELRGRPDLPLNLLGVVDEDDASTSTSLEWAEFPGHAR